MMNDEKRLSEDELAAIADTYSDEITLDGMPLLMPDEIIQNLLAGFNVARDDIQSLLQHIRALENELAIERAQAARGDWLGD